MADEYVPTTEEGKAALAGGADPDVVRSMEEDGTYPADEPKDPKKPEHVDTTDADTPNGEDAGKKKEDDPPKDPVDPPAPVDRAVTHIPIWKTKEMVKKAKEEGAAEARAALEAAGHQEGGASDADIKALSEEFGIREDLVPTLIERLGGVIAKKIPVLSDEDRAALNTVREQSELTAQTKGFETEWTSDATQQAIELATGSRAVSPETKARIQELAFSETYHRYRLSDIIRLEAGQLFPKGSKTAEPGRGGTGRVAPTVKSIDDMSPEDIGNLSDKEFDELANHLAGGQSRFTKVTPPAKPTKR